MAWSPERGPERGPENKVPCPYCHGKGKDAKGNDCKPCNGTGQVRGGG